jgi:hypothetical protein
MREEIYRASPGGRTTDEGTCCLAEKKKSQITKEIPEEKEKHQIK